MPNQGTATQRLRKQKAIIKKLKSQGLTFAKESVISPSPATIMPGIPKVHVLPFDFEPVGSNNYDLNWPGPPRRSLSWADVKFYKPKVKLESNAPTDISFFFWIKEDITAWPDKTLGYFYVKIRQGKKSPEDSDIVGPSGNGDAPLNAPSESRGSFYLGCTKKGNVKGSDGKNGRHANVYLEIFDIAGTAIDIDWYYDKNQSPRHSIRCR